jgi:multidrug resistance efflux pump
MPLEITPVTQSLTTGHVAPELGSYAHEILGRTPPWILRSGTWVVAGAVVVVLALACLVQYPDTVAGKVTITGVNPAVSVVARQSGHLEQLRVVEGQKVEAGHLLGVIKNTANTEEMLRLKEQLKRLQPFLGEGAAIEDVTMPTGGNLGSVQASYGDFLGRYRHYQAFLKDDYAAATVAILREQFKHKRSQLEELRAQAAAAKRETELAKEGFERMRTIHARGGISTAEIQANERQYLEQQRQNSTVEKALLEEEIAAAGYEKQIRETEHKQAEDLRTLGSALAESLKKLLAEVDQWESLYVLKAPASGVVAFYDFWTDQQFVTEGKAVFIIAPDTSVLLGRVPVNQGGAGKIRPGQIVRIRLDDYPAKEFGLLSGSVRSVSLVAQAGQQLVTVSLDYPLKTSYGRSLDFKQEMTGQSMIVTDDRRLIDRLFSEIRRALFQPVN